MPGPTQEFDLEAAPGQWRLTRADPCPALSGLVVEYWEVFGTLSAFRETLLPNGCVELMLNLGPSHRLLSEQGAGTWDGAWFSGLHERSLIIESMDGTHLVSVRMTPLAAVELLGAMVAECVNSVVELSTVLGEDAATLRTSIAAASDPVERFSVLETFLLRRRRQENAAPDFVRNAVIRIEQAHGNLRVTELHHELAVSRKHLAVMFKHHVGISAKAYANVRRFVWTLQRLRESTSVDWSKLAAESGYSDQSHLVRDFRRLGAASPTEYLRHRAPEGDALLYDAG